MTEYNFFGIAEFNGGYVRDRFKIEADSFEEACHHAQSWERYEAEIEEGYEATVYDRFELIDNG